MNKKNGVGCTTLTYNLGRLFEIPIYVKEDCFMLDDNHKDYFEDVSKITPSKKGGIFDIGADFNKAYSKKLIENEAKVIVIPMDFGYESIIDTIETIKYIREIDEARSNQRGENIETPIVLILNRLDKQDGAKDFNYKEYLKLKFRDAGIRFDREYLVLTYLRHSYALYSDLDIGGYFLDKFLKPMGKKDRKFDMKYIKNFEYRKLLYFAYEAMFQTDYTNEDIYIQDKDMVEFRNKFITRYKNNMRGYNSIHNEIENYCSRNSNNTPVYQENKLIKDMAFIAYSIFEYIANEDNDIRRLLHLY